MPLSPRFFSDGIPFVLPHATAVAQWLRQGVREEQCVLGTLNYIFCDDAYLHQLNKTYLQHDTFTDVITFDHGEKGLVAGDAYVSIPGVVENAQNLHLPFAMELHRVMVHAILHLVGYQDKMPSHACQMRIREDYHLGLRPALLL